MRARTAGVVLGLAALTAATPALAQLLGPPLPPLVRGLPNAADRLERAPLRLEDPAEGLLARTRDVSEAALADLRRLTVERLLREHPRYVEADEAGRPVVRGEVLALTLTPDALARIEAAGFRVARRGELGGLGLETVVLNPPKGVSAREAVRRLEAIDPEGAYEFNHLYQASGEARAPGRWSAAGVAPGAGAAAGLRLGLVDGSAAADHPALRRAKVTQRAFAPGGPRMTDHATAVASLMVGQAGPLRGAAPGASLYVADVYGTTPAGGSAEAIARGLAWLAQNRVPVVNISLVGPRNRLLEQAVAALNARGVAVVAAVGNDGPAAPPLYPAAYPGVVAVTAVNGRRQALPEAGRGAHVAFAAPGADMAAAGAGGGYLAVRGTSFAAPLVAGLIAQQGGRTDGLAAADLGAAGRDPVYGGGLVGFDLRTEPRRVGARALALRSH
ncbi:S8 family serine peptidase [Phenylobacterium sp. J426]|uniref:S8 family serine peptidase n=1 Tax=Phenylobacterium sp. J426 TaxID=2898439 RepID=UPI0021516AFF|nr:S8 family serine peptidase [Phenylobacterium sp. J426]MCR5876770.1 S8 family serine peptidase [Phenylobacterium sp. J426]